LRRRSGFFRSQTGGIEKQRQEERVWEKEKEKDREREENSVEGA